MARDNLSDAKVRSAKPGAKPYKLYDGGGLFLLVQPNGSRYWRLKYRIAAKEKLLAIGVSPDVSLSEARAKALGARPWQPISTHTLVRCRSGRSRSRSCARRSCI